MSQRILVELDSLMDTRLGTIAKLWPEVAGALATTEYRSRASNNLTLLDSRIVMSEFKEAYAKRDVSTLKASVITGGVVIINDLVNQLERQAIDTPFIDKVEVDVNYYPYKLTKDLTHALQSAIMAYCGLDATVTMVSHSPESLTTRAISDNWAVLIMYDINEWLEFHGQNLPAKPIPGVNFIIPAVYMDAVPADGEVVDDNGDNVNSFTALEMGLVEYVTINCVDIDFFSIIRA